MCSRDGLRERIDELWESGELDAEPIEEAIELLDRGELRVAEPRRDGWVVNEWAKKAILLYFRLGRWSRWSPGTSGTSTRSR